MRVITVKEAREAGLTSSQIWAAATWNGMKACQKDTPQTTRNRLWAQAEALEQVAKELEAIEKRRKEHSAFIF